MVGDNYNTTVVFEYFKREELGRGDRGFSRSADHSGKPNGSDRTSLATPVANVYGLVTDNFLAAPQTYDFNPDISLSPRMERFSG